MTTPSLDPTDNGPLEAALRQLGTTPDPQLRDQHIAVALGHLASTNTDVPNNVVSLTSRRPNRVFIALSAVAAVGLFVLGLGIGQRGNGVPPEVSLVKNAAPSSSVDTRACASTEVSSTTDTFLLMGTPPALVAKEVRNGVSTLTVYNADTCAILWQVPAK
jgi:hypothetical protein